jgi:magnesium-protoporphyrin O-methyltransferase
MDSLIHYDTPDIVAALDRLSLRTRGSLLFTFAPRTPLLAAMHGVGRLFPRSDRSPALTPVSQPHLRRGLQARIGRRLAGAKAAASAWPAASTPRRPGSGTR